MPKLVSELTPGAAERSVDGGRSADSYTRNWRIILLRPDEGYDIQQAINVKIGDPHPNSTAVPVPCISISERADGDSRMVRLVTATYKTTPGENPSQDPNSQAPDVRPAKYSITSSLIEVPATDWRKLGDIWGPINPNAPFGMGGPLMGIVGQGLGNAEDTVNPNKDRYDGVTKLVPLVNITIEQFDNFPVSRLDDAGKINSDKFKFLGLEVAAFSCMLRGISVRPHVETFGDITYRGFTRTFEFSIKTHGGWLIDQIIEGFNIKNANLGGPDVYTKGLILEHDGGHVKGPPYQLVNGLPNDKGRAVVPIHAPNGKWMQRPSAQPVALNLDGTPRDVENANPPVLRQKYCTQGDTVFGDNFSGIGVRIYEVI